MTWRKLAAVILLSPVLIGSGVLFCWLVAWKLPSVCCERWRRVRYLPWVGAGYYGSLIALATVLLGLDSRMVLLLVGVAAVCGEWLLPDPYTFLADPRKRRAVVRAIERHEAHGGPIALYGMVAVIGSEVGRLIVSVPFDSGCIPPGRRFFAVSDDGAPVEEVDYEFASAHGARPWY